MNNIVKVIGGSGFLVSGTLIWNIILAGLDWDRIDRYGLLHELGLYGLFAICIALFGTILIATGIYLIYNSIMLSEQLSRDEETD